MPSCSPTQNQRFSLAPANIVKPIAITTENIDMLQNWFGTPKSTCPCQVSRIEPQPMMGLRSQPSCALGFLRWRNSSTESIIEANSPSVPEPMSIHGTCWSSQFKCVGCACRFTWDCCFTGVLFTWDAFFVCLFTRESPFYIYSLHWPVLTAVVFVPLARRNSCTCSVVSA